MINEDKFKSMQHVINEKRDALYPGAVLSEKISGGHGPWGEGEKRVWGPRPKKIF